MWNKTWSPESLDPCLSTACQVLEVADKKMIVVTEWTFEGRVGQIPKPDFRFLQRRLVLFSSLTMTSTLVIISYLLVGFPNSHKSLGWGIRLYSPSSSLFPFSFSNSNKYPHFPFTCSLMRLNSVHQFSSWCSSSLLRLEQVQPKNSGKNSLSWKWLLRRGQRPGVSPCRQSQEEEKAETCSHIFPWELWGGISVPGFTWPREGKTRAVGCSWRSWRRCCWRWILHPTRLSFWTQVFTIGFCNERNNTWHLPRVKCDQDGWTVQEDLRKESVTTFHKVLVESTLKDMTPMFSIFHKIQVGLETVDTVLVEGKDLQIFYVGFG